MGEKDPRGDAGQSWGFDGCILQFQKWQEMLGRRGVHQDCCPGGQLLGVGSQEQQGSRARFPGGSTLVVELEPGLSPMAASQLLLDLHRQLCSQDEWQQLRNAADIPQLMLRAAAGGCISQKCGLGRRPVAQG